MNLNFLRAVVAFDETESLVAAARRLGVSHSAVSQQIKALEDELQILILDRMTRPPRLTDEGLRLVDHARRMLVISEDIRAIRESDALSGSVRIGVVPSALVHLMPSALARLRIRHPAIDIQIRSALSEQLMADVLTRDLDMALTTMPDPVPDGVSAALVGQEPLDVIAAATLPEQPLEELLASQPFIWFSRRTWTGQRIEHHLRRRRILVKTAMEIDSIEAIEALVANGFGVSVSPRRIGAAETPELRRIPLSDPPLTRDLGLVSLERTPRKRAVAALLRELSFQTD